LIFPCSKNAVWEEKKKAEYEKAEQKGERETKEKKEPEIEYEGSRR